MESLEQNQTRPNPPRRKASKEERKRQLIEATMECIATHGISGTTVSEVAKQAGLSTGIVNFHFVSKERLLEEVLDFLAKEHRNQWHTAIQAEGLSEADKLHAIVEAHFHPFICNRKKLAVWFAFYGESATRASYRAIMSEIDDERWAVATDLISSLIKEGGYQNVEAINVASTLEGLFDGLALSIMIYPGEFSNTDGYHRAYEYLCLCFPQHFKPLPKAECVS